MEVVINDGIKKNKNMNKYRITFKTGWKGGIGYDTTSVKEIKARDFEEAYERARHYEWGLDVCAKIMSIEMLEED